jgi:predicted nucleic acid-binding protein
MTLIVDASVAVKWFVREEGHVQARGLLQSDRSVRAPDLILSEVGNALWRKARVGEVLQEQAILALTALPNYVERLIPAAELSERALAIALTLDHPVYDCFYLAAVETIDGGSVVTDDQRFHTATAKSVFADRVTLLGAV